MRKTIDDLDVAPSSAWAPLSRSKLWSLNLKIGSARNLSAAGDSICDERTPRGNRGADL